MQAKVKAENRFDGVTAGTRVYSKGEWRRVLPEWEETVVSGYADVLDFRDDPLPEPAPVATPQSGPIGPVDDVPTPQGGDPAQQTPATSTGAVDAGLGVPDVVGDAVGESSGEDDAELEADALADETEAAEADRIAAELEASDATAAARVKAEAQAKRQAAAKKRAGKKAGK